jgi:chemotaxis protein methyltransferase CheR
MALPSQRGSESATGLIPGPAYRILTELVYQHSRIRLGPDKQTLVANRLRKRLVALGLDSYEDYCAELQSARGPDELEELVDLIATNHTAFYREPGHFAFLTRRVLPALLPELRAARAPLRLWSAAASSGEEPYTLAITVAESLQACPGVEWQITATDISRRMLAAAEQGIYPMEAVKPVPPDLLKRYFQKGVGARAGLCRVKPELRQRLQFARVNLFQPTYPVPAQLHVIFCRNVMIYFDVPSRALAVQRLAQHLAPGGFLVVGHSESLLGIRHGLHPVQQGVYQKP